MMDEEKLGLMGNADVYVVHDAKLFVDGHRSGHRTRPGSWVDHDGLVMLTICRCSAPRRHSTEKRRPTVF